MDWIQFAYLAAGLVGGALAKHIASGAKPVVDPTNQRPAVDSLRDMIRSEILAIWGSSSAPSTPPANPAPVVVPTNPALPPLDANAVLQQLGDLLKQALTHLAAAQTQAPATPPAVVPKAAA